MVSDIYYYLNSGLLIFVVFCQILTISLTDKMSMHVIKNILMKTMFKYESNDIIFVDMHQHFVS